MLLHWSELENGVLSTVKQKYAGDILKHLRSSEISTHDFHENNTKLNGGRIKYRQVCTCEVHASCRRRRLDAGTVRVIDRVRVLGHDCM